MKKINKKGFTLVEIIITLAIVITITTVAVGSYIGISKNKKKEEWSLVKKQIETAAEQYISTNKYMYEDLDSNGLSAYISVGTLVETDYLNKVVDPETKKELDKCALVEVKISSSGKYTATYIGKTDDDTNCSNTNKSIVFKEAKAADIEVNVSKLDNTHDNIGDWYDTGAKYTLNIKSRKKSVTNVKYCIGNSSCSPDTDISSDYSVKYTASSGEDEKNKYACFVVTAMSGGTAKRSKACNYANIDNSNPTCTAKFTNANSYGWTNNTAIVKPNTCFDTGVGCATISDKNTYSDETSGTDLSVKVKDSFDHEGTCSATVKVDKTAPTFDVGLYKRSGGSYSDDTWLSGYVNTRVENAIDTLSGIASYSYTTRGATTNDTNRNGSTRNIDAEGKSTIKYRVCDKADNCSDSSTYTIKLDRTAPTFSVGLYNQSGGSYSNNTWLSGYVTTRVENASDNLTGIKSYSYTTRGETTNDTDRNGSARNINAEGKSTIIYRVCDNVDNCRYSSTYTIKLDRTAPKIKYISQPTPKKCGGEKGVYIKYQVSDNLSGVKETYHYYGEDTGRKSYSTIKGYDMKVVHNTKAEILGPITVERTWAVDNPKGCASENKNGPNTSWCYYNNTAVKDYAGNTQTAISQKCSKVGE